MVFWICAWVFCLGSFGKVWGLVSAEGGMEEWEWFGLSVVVVIAAAG